MSVGWMGVSMLGGADIPVQTYVTALCSIEKILLHSIELRDGIFNLEDEELMNTIDIVVCRLAAMACARRPHLPTAAGAEAA
jgi:hypothetical protein